MSVELRRLGPQAGWLFRACLYASTASIVAATVRADALPLSAAAPRVAEEREEGARDSLLRARVRFDESDYAGAALEYARAVEQLPPGPRRRDALSNMALCYERAFMYGEAVASYERYLREAEPQDAERVELEHRMRSLRERLGGLRITSDVRAELYVDDKPRGFTPIDLALSGGEHVVELRADGRENTRRAVMISPRGLVTLALTLPEKQLYLGPRPAYFYAAAGLTAAAAIVGSGLGLRALGLHRSADQDRRRGLDTDGARHDIANLALGADVAFGTTALFASSALVLYFLTDFRAQRGHAGHGVIVRPGVAHAAAGVTIAGVM